MAEALEAENKRLRKEAKALGLDVGDDFEASSVVAAPSTDVALSQKLPEGAHDWLLDDGENTPRKLPALWKVLFASFLMLFIFLIFWQITARPLHHDEGVNCWFMDRLIEKNLWNYDPENYHGPILYYVTLVYVWVNNWLHDRPISSLLGLSVTCIRSVPATMGVLLLLAVAFGVRHRLGNLGALLAFILTGFCNDQLWISRYFIHENFFTFFTLCVYITGTKYLDTKSPLWAMALFASMSALHASKEFAIVHVTILILADLCSRLTLWIMGVGGWPFGKAFFSNGWRHLREHGLLHFVLGLCAFFVVWFPLFSSFGSNWAGLKDSVRTYSYWGKEGWGNSGHNKPFWWWINSVLSTTEQGPFFGALLSSGVALWKQERKGLMIMYWFLGFLGCYSLLPYKTVWCVPCLLLPMIMLIAYATTTLITHIVKSPSIRGKKVAIAAVLAVLGLSIAVDWIRVTYDLNYVRWDANDIYPQPYVHTTRDVFRMVEWIDEAAAASGKGADLPLRFTCDAYHPVPFYLQRKYNMITWGTSSQDITRARVAGADILVCDQKHSAAVRQFLTTEFYETRKYRIRPGADVEMFVRRRLFSNSKVELIEAVPTGPKDTSQLVKGLGRSVYSGNDYGEAGNLLEFRPSMTDLSFFYGMSDARPFNSPFSYIWNGFLQIEHAGIYEFFQGSDDGSLLYVDSKLVIDNDGAHAFIEVSAKVALAEGLHQFEVKYMDFVGEVKFDLQWSGPKINGRQPIPSEQLLSFPDDKAWRQWLMLGDSGENGDKEQKANQVFVYGGKRLVPGLQQEICSGTKLCNQQVGLKPDTVSIGLENTKLFFNSNDAPKHSSPFAVMWKGFLRIQQKGMYTFKLGSDDGSVLYIDGRVVVETEGSYQQESIRLEEGFFKFVLGFVDLGNVRELSLEWMFEGKKFEPIASSSFFAYQDPTAFEDDQILPALVKSDVMYSSGKKTQVQLARRIGIVLGPVDVVSVERGITTRSLSEDVLIKYSALWGYDLFSELNRSGVRIVDALKKNWHAGYEWFVWVNHDVVITNPRKRFDTVIDQHATDSTHLLFSRLQDGKINTGMFMIRGSPQAYKLLTEWASLVAREDPSNTNPAAFLQSAIDQSQTQVVVLPDREILSHANRVLRHQPDYHADIDSATSWKEGDHAVLVQGCLEKSANDEASCNGVATYFWHHFRVELENLHRESQQFEAGPEAWQEFQKDWLLAFPADQCAIRADTPKSL
eukprot:gb/GEZN01000536.1/.p1 GENE.gb/GEZN01000536.1/~~gb/GEZN01000536.1/.p1  ORF type:complete len:1229 (-),score=138.74 gb/GEZN01000536.1/:438-4124(-)